MMTEKEIKANRRKDNVTDVVIILYPFIILFILIFVSITVSVILFWISIFINMTAHSRVQDLRKKEKYLDKLDLKRFRDLEAIEYTRKRDIFFQRMDRLGWPIPPDPSEYPAQSYSYEDYMSDRQAYMERQRGIADAAD